MKKYFEVFRTTLAEYFTYRLNFILWRLRVILNLLIIYFLWASIFEDRTQLFGYSKPQMLTYILLSSFIANFVLATKTIEIADDIINGNIINYILKPISLFKFYLTRDLSDKLVNFSFAFLEIALIIVFFQPETFFQTNFSTLFVFIIFFIIGALIAFYINLSLSFIGFWTNEVWAPRFIYFILIFFFSGSYFPLDILPKPLYYLLLLTPFPYFFYLPTKIYLRGINNDLILEITISFAWIFLSYAIAKLMWRKGIKSYSFFGR